MHQYYVARNNRESYSLSVCAWSQFQLVSCPSEFTLEFVFAGIMLINEQEILENMTSDSNLYFVPLVWAASLVNRARKEGRIKDDHSVKTLIDVLSSIFTFKKIFWLFLLGFGWLWKNPIVDGIGRDIQQMQYRCGSAVGSNAICSVNSEVFPYFTSKSRTFIVSFIFTVFVLNFSLCTNSPYRLVHN